MRSSASPDASCPTCSTRPNIHLQKPWVYLWSEGKTASFELVPAGPGATLVLELQPGAFRPPPPMPPGEMAERGEKAFGPLPPLLRAADGSPIERAERWADRRKELRAAIWDAIGSRPDLKPAPLEATLVSEESVPPQAWPVSYRNPVTRAYTRRKVSIQLRPGERMNVWVLVPPGIGPFPAVMALHQTVPEGKDEPVGLGGHYWNLSYGPFLASRGYVVVAPDSPTAGERSYPGMRYPYDTEAMEKRDPNWTLLGQRTHDHLRTLDYMASLPFVDRRRLGVIGHSLGGESGAMLAALDDRLAAAVISCPFTLMRTLDNPRTPATSAGAAAAYASLSGEGGSTALASERWRKLLKVPVKDRKLPFDFDQVMALWSPTPVFFHGVRDEIPQWPNVAQVAQAARSLEQVYRQHGAPDHLHVRYSPVAHSFPEWVQPDAFDWLDHWLK
jgi:dienelactone hydrolase